eukprot:371066-Pelagomonas_calceolata.AAC.4
MHAHDRWPQSTERYAGTTLKAFERQALLLRIISSTMPSYLAVFLLGAKTLSPSKLYVLHAKFKEDKLTAS